MALKGLQVLYNLILKNVAKESGQASGILSIGKDVRKLADKKLQRYITAAKKQGVDLNNLSEQEAKYMLELNKPKAPTVLSNEEAYDFLNQFLNQGKKGKVIKGKFGKSFSQEVDDIADKKLIEQMYRTSGPRSLDEDAGYLAEFIAEDAGKVLDDLPIEEQTKFIERAKNALRKNVKQYQPEELVTVDSVITDIKKLEPIESMKETNRVLRGEGKYKNLSKADREKIAGDESVTDHIFERNIKYDADGEEIIDWDAVNDIEPEDFASGGKAKESWTDKLTRWGGGPSVLAGELGLEGLNQIYQLLNMPGLYNKGGRAGLSYLLAEDSNQRIPLAGGGSGKPPINFYVDFSGSGGGKQENYLGVPGLNEGGYNYGGTLAADTTFPFLGGDLSVGGELGIGRDKSNVDYKGQPIDWLSNVGEKKLGDDWNVGFKWRKKFAGGGMGRRAFLKLMAALRATGAAAKYGLAGLLKGGGKKQVVESLTSVPIKSGVDGMPAWFKPLVNKVIKEGDDVTKKFATKEREIVHTKKLGNPKDKFADEITVTQDLETGNVRVEYDTVHNMGEAPIQLDYKAGEIIEEGSKKGTKTKAEFSAVESEPRITNWDGDIEFDGENVVSKVDDLLTDTTKLESYATGKSPTIKKLLKSEQKKKYVKNLNDDQMEQLEYIENKEGYDAMEFIDESERVGAFKNTGPETKGMNLPQKKASGGLARMLGE